MGKTRLSEIFKRREIDHKQAAKDLGIERRTLDNYLSESTLMNSDMIKKMAAYLHVSTDYLLGVDTLDEDFLNDKVDAMCAEIKEILYHLKKD